MNGTTFKKQKLASTVLMSALLSSALMLGACSSDDDDNTSSGATETPPSNNNSGNNNGGNNNNNNTDPNRDPKLSDPAAADNCILQNVVLDPPSGSTLRTGDVLKVTIDYSLIADVSERVFFYGYLHSVDNDDYFDDWEQAQFTGSGNAGRHINNFTFRINPQDWYNDSDHYTQLILEHGPDAGCDEVYPVNYIILVD